MNYDFKGMTVNERLYVSGMIDEFDEAVFRGDKEKVKDILFKVEVENECNVLEILKSLGFE